LSAAFGIGGYTLAGSASISLSPDLLNTHRSKLSDFKEDR